MPELIDKTAAYNALKHEAETHELSFSAEAYDRAARIIDQMPTIEAEPVRHGRWIAVSSFDAFGGDEEAWMAHGNPTAYHYCSECKNEAYANEEGKEILSDYCSFCGARMEGGAENG